MSAAIREARQACLELMGWRFVSSPHSLGIRWTFVAVPPAPTRSPKNFTAPARSHALQQALDWATMQEGEAADREWSNAAE